MFNSELNFESNLLYQRRLYIKATGAIYYAPDFGTLKLCSRAVGPIDVTAIRPSTFLYQGTYGACQLRI